MRCGTPLIVLAVLVGGVQAQFAEIASVIGSVLGSGAGLGSAAGAATAAGTGAAGALGNIGQLYQLAQTALSLTGTGVGIVNQASESSWFPAAVEHAVKANRDFQERLIANQGNTGGNGISPLMPGGGSGSLGKEYGKNFETEGGGGDPEPDYDLEGTKSPSLERELAELEKQERKTTPPPTFATRRPVAVEAGVDEFGRPSEILPTPAALAARPPVVTVHLPEKSKKLDSTDYEELIGKSPDLGFSEDDMDPEEEHGVPRMVPELHKLIRALKASNLSKEEFLEIAKQLEGNRKTVPRENTTPVTPPKSSELGSGETTPPPPKKTGKNLPALKRILGVGEETTTSPEVTTTTEAPVVVSTEPTEEPEPSKTPSVVHIHPRHVVSSNANFRPTPPRAVPTVVPPHPIVAGVAQKQFASAGTLSPYQPQPLQQTQPQATQQQPQPLKQAQPQVHTYSTNSQHAYNQYHQQYQDYIRKYYPAYAQALQNQQQFLFPQTQNNYQYQQQGFNQQHPFFAGR